LRGELLEHRKTAADPEMVHRRDLKPMLRHPDRHWAG
jgi:hypothetical protein